MANPKAGWLVCLDVCPSIQTCLALCPYFTSRRALQLDNLKTGELNTTVIEFKS